MGIPPPHDAVAPSFAFLRRSMPYLWGIGVGVAFAGMVLGWDFVTGDPLVVRQVAGDNAAGLAAFRAYLADGWHWPLLAAPGFGDAGVNVAFSDSIPLLAVVAKVARPLGVEAETWWGAWFALVYGAQGFGAVFAVRSWGARSVAAQLAAPLLAVSMPVLLLQTVHPSLSAHGVLLVAWGLAGRARAGWGSAPALGGFVALTVASLAIHPYLAAMVAAMAAGVAGDGRRGAVVDDRWSGRRTAGWLAALVVAAGGWVLAGGYLDSAGPSEGGYGQYATSLAGPLVPTLSSLLDAEPDGFEIAPSHPGYAYLGLGLIGLGLVAVVVQRRRLVAIVRSNQLLAVALLLLVLWAVSPWVRIATGEQLALPEALAARLGSARRAGVAVAAVGLGATAALATIVGWSQRATRTRQPAAGFAPAVVAGAGVVAVGSLVGLLAPDVLGAAMSQFRASGRFAWPVLYGVLVFAVVAVDPGRWPSGSGRRARVPLLSAVVLAAAVLIQVIDTSTLRRFAHELLVPGGTERRDYVEVLVELVEAHDRVVLGPDFRCTYYPDGVGSFIDVTGAASAAQRPIDRIYSARRPQSEPCTVAQTVDLSDPGALIVLVEPVAVLTEQNALDEIAEHCRQRGTLNVCSHRWDDVPPEVLAQFGPVAD